MTRNQLKLLNNKQRNKFEFQYVIFPFKAILQNSHFQTSYQNLNSVFIYNSFLQLTFDHVFRRLIRTDFFHHSVFLANKVVLH